MIVFCFYLFYTASQLYWNQGFGITHPKSLAWQSNLRANTTAHTLFAPKRRHFDWCQWQTELLDFSSFRPTGQGLPHSRLRGPWCKGCCRRTSPRRWRPGSAAPCHSCRRWRRATPQTGGSCRWSSAWPRPSVVWGRSSAPCLLSFLLRQHRKAVGGQTERKRAQNENTSKSLHSHLPVWFMCTL